VSTATALAIVLLALVGFNLAVRAWRSRRRSLASRLDAAEPELRRREGVSARIFVDKTLRGGPKSGGFNQDNATVVLSAQRLIVASQWGRVLTITHDRPGDLRWVGPGRMVIEGQHPSGRAQTRVELILSDVDEWLDACGSLPGARVVRPAAGARPGAS
jgi:hypothetical protein